MRLLVDANLPPRFAAALATAGHDAVHVFDVELGTADDQTILLWAEANAPRVTPSRR